MRMKKEDVLHQMATLKFLPCPFCGRVPTLLITDDEGNIKDNYMDYLDDQWSGLSFQISHEITDENDCPVASHEDMEVGCLMYETPKRAVKTWNRRIK